MVPETFHLRYTAGYDCGDNKIQRGNTEGHYVTLALNIFRLSAREKGEFYQFSKLQKFPLPEHCWKMTVKNIRSM